MVSDPVTAGAPAFGAPVAPQPPPPTQLWRGRHGVPIAAVFAAEDGGAAVSIDELNHARLWPTLDGTREPLVLPLAMPKEVVVARDGDGLAIASLDVSGGLEVLAVDAAGRLTSHARRPPEPGVAAIVAHDGGFLVLHRDQTLEQLDARGATRASLLAAPGEHVLKLLGRNRRTLALVRTKEGVRGHWFAVGALAWGEHTPKLHIDLNRVFLSPDHAHLITFRPTTGEVLLVDLETGRSRQFATNELGVGSQGLPIGFSGDNKVVFALDDFELSTLEWWTLAEHRVAVLGGSDAALEFVAVDAPVVTDKNVIAFSGHELAIATQNDARGPSKVVFLGYRKQRARGVRGSPAGAVATFDRSALLLDDELHAVRRIPAAQAIPLHDDLALIQLVPPPPPLPAPVPRLDPEWLEITPGRPLPRSLELRLALHDLEQNRDVQRWPQPRAFYFEPATRLLAIERAGKVELATFDPAARRFGAPRTLATGGARVALLDPAQSAGVLALFVRVQRGTSEVRALADLAGELSAPVTVAGVVEEVDRAGRLYVRESADTIAIVHGDRPRVRLDGMTGWTVRPSPTGAQIAAFARNRFALFDAAGASLWSVGFPGIKNAAWTAGGALLALAGDVAKIDVATGEVIAAQCGWGFALRTRRPDPTEFPSTAETTCDR